MRCPKCKFDNPKYEKYCLNCNELLKSSSNKRRNPPGLNWIVFLVIGIILVLFLLVLFRIIEIQGISDLIKPTDPSITSIVELTETPKAILTLEDNSDLPSDQIMNEQDPDPVATAVEETLQAINAQSGSNDYVKNGKIIFYEPCGLCVNDDVFIMDADGTNLKQLLGPDIVVGDFDVSLSAGKIAFTALGGTIGECLGDCSYIGEMIQLGEIYTIDFDGTNINRLTNNDFYDGSVAWSPDGNRILFLSEKDNSDNIYSMNADGSDKKQLTNNLLNDSIYYGQPLWSSDSSKIIFNSNRDGSNELYSINSDGRELLQLTNITADEYEYFWSPDGKKILFKAFFDNNNYSQLFVMNSNGNNLITISEPTSKGTHVYAKWSPDNRYIAYLEQINVYETEPISNIFIVEPDGSNPNTLINIDSRIDDFNWFPDGQNILYLETNSIEHANFFNANLDGKGSERIFTTDYVGQFTISPNGKKVVFTQTENYLPILYLMNSDGSELTKITELIELFSIEIVDWLPLD